MLNLRILRDSTKRFFLNTIKILIDFPYITFLLIKDMLASTRKSLFRQPKNLDNEIILVTGAASGLGQLVVWKLAKMSSTAVFVLWDINAEGLEKTAEKCQEMGAFNVHLQTVDLSNREGIVRAANLVLTQIGVVTILFNNAGLANPDSFLDSSPETEERILQVNLMSHMWTIREFLPKMIERGSGHLVSTCSALAFHKFPYFCSYVASKYGLRGFLESLRLEIGMYPGKPRIKISVVYPGWVKTPMTTGGLTWESRYEMSILKYMDPDDVAEKMVEGVLKEEKEVFIPPSLRHLILINGYFPINFVSTIFENYMFKNIALIKNEVLKSVPDTLM